MAIRPPVNYATALRGLVSVEQLSAVTRIRTSDLTQYLRGSWMPSAKSSSALKSVYINIQTIRLNMAGASTKESKRWSNTNPFRVQSLIAGLDNMSSTIAKKRGLTQAFIVAHMNKSDATLDEWEEAAWGNPYA